MQLGRKFVRDECGSSLIEMMISIVVLTVGLIGTVALIAVSIGSNVRSKRGSTGVALAEMVISQISALPVGGSVTSVTVSDCAGNNLTINASGTSAGSGANLSGGNIDFTQTFSAVSSGYAMHYTVCGVNTGEQTVYDVRWNVQLLPSGKAEFVVVGAQYNSITSGNVRLTAAAVNLRTVVGNDGT